MSTLEPHQLEVTTTILLLTNDSSYSPSEKGLDYYIWVYVSPVVFFMGLVGNLLSIAVLHGRPFKRTTTAVYLPLIAIADSLVLLTGLLVEWLEWTQLQSVKEANVWSCRLHKVLFYTAGDVSIWLIVAFTFDRFIAVCFPLSKRTVCAPRRSFIVAMTIFVLSFAKNVHEFWTRGPQYDVTSGRLTRLCGYPQEFYHFHSYIRPWLAFAVITALPFLLIFVFNCMIVHSLIRSQRMRAQAVALAAVRQPEVP
jgi:signal transduction histidine kinase